MKKIILLISILFLILFIDAELIAQIDNVDNSRIYNAVTTVDTNVDAILVDTGTTLPDTLSKVLRETLEIERHFHGRERWFGKSGDQFASRKVQIPPHKALRSVPGGGGSAP